MALGLGAGLGKGGIISSIPGIVTDSLVMKHMYPVGSVQPVSNGACLIGAPGTEDRITITATIFNVHEAAHTFAFWAKRNVTGVDQCVLGHLNTKNYKYIRFESDNTLIIESDTNTDRAIITPHTTDKEWHHYAITITGSGETIVAYQDGVLLSDSGDVGDDNLTINLIGAQGAGGAENEFNGYLCNIGIWEAVLTQPQVKSIMWKQYAELTTAETSGLVAWYTLDTNANDSTGTHNGTTTGF